MLPRSPSCNLGVDIRQGKGNWKDKRGEIMEQMNEEMDGRGREGRDGGVKRGREEKGKGGERKSRPHGHF